VIDTDYEVDENEEGSAKGSEVAGGTITHRNPKIIINPEILSKEGEIILCEGCLSVPDYTAEVKRAEKIKLKYKDMDGVEKTMTAEGLQAVAIQHEIDHLDGKLFIDRLSPLKKEMVRKRLRKERLENEPKVLAGLSPQDKRKKGF
ncbi:MAG: peptide deformylase, partial [Bdellovibrionota bacterium]